MASYNKVGSEPINIIWSVVRGDTASLRIDFLNNDESTYWDTSDWSYQSSAYDKKEDFTDTLEVEEGSGYVIITATPEVTENWGEGYDSVVNELQFDLKVLISDNNSITAWTPVIGTIRVFGNVTLGDQ